MKGPKTSENLRKSGEGVSSVQSAKSVLASRKGRNPEVDFLKLIEPLSKREKRVLEIAEKNIAKGFRSFLEVGFALKEIRDRRLYREKYGTFEEYVITRWELSRPRAYELLQASETVRDLSAIADKLPLPENEAQVRPLTRLKDATLRQKAWLRAQERAEAEGRRVTARDTEEAVRRLNGKSSWEVDEGVGEGVYTCCVGDNSDLIKSVARLYLRKRDRIADTTFGKGSFWRRINLANYQFWKSDKITCPEAPHDFRDTPYEDNFFDVVVLDPPYAYHGHSLMVERNYNHSSTTQGLYHRDIIKLYRGGIREAFRILKPGGLIWVKTQDEVETSTQRRSHIEVYHLALEIGFEDQDLFVLMPCNSPTIQVKKQQHARKNHSFLWVFRKPSLKRSRRTGSANFSRPL